jgi:hypothetical protein
VKLHNESTIQVGTYSINSEMSLPQGSILSPEKNVSLKEVLKSYSKLEIARKREDLLAFTDDMLVKSSNKIDMATIIDELRAL